MAKEKDIKNQIENLTVEAKILTSAIEVETNKFSQSMSKSKQELDISLEKLKELNVMLQTLPKKLAAQLKDSTPEVAKHLDEIIEKKQKELDASYQKLIEEKLNSIANQSKEIFENIDNKLQKQLTDSTSLIKKFDQITQKEDSINKKRIFRFFLSVTISAAVSVGCAIYAASYMMQTFPTRVTIDKPTSNIILYDSDINIWDDKTITLLKSLRTNNRVNKGKY